MSRMKNTRKTNKPKSRIPLILLIVAGGLLLLAGGYLFLNGDRSVPSAAPEVSGTPSLQVDQEQIDFGDVPFSQYVTASFELTNAGDAPLQFTEQPYVELKAGC